VRVRIAILRAFFLLRESAVCHPERSCGEWGVGVRDRREAILSVSCEILATYYVYIMTNRTRRLYVGVTNDLGRRVYQHKHHVMPGFTSKYFLERLVYFEETNDVRAAISREKELKGWRRSKKIALIEKLNPRWSDLSCGWSE
jgi:putative endonuclease